MTNAAAWILSWGFFLGCATVAFAIVLAAKALVTTNWRIVNSGETRQVHLTKEQFDEMKQAGGAA